MRSKQLYLGAKSCRIKRGIPSADIGTPHNHDVLKRRTSCWKSFSSRPSASKNFSFSNAPIDSPARADGKHADDAPFLVKPVDDAVRIRTEPHPVRIVVSPHFDGAKRHGIELEIVDRLAGLPDEGWISEPAQIAFRPGFQYDPHSPEAMPFFHVFPGNVFRLFRSLPQDRSVDLVLLLFGNVLRLLLSLRADITAGSTGIRIFGGKAPNSCISLRAVIPRLLSSVSSFTLPPYLAGPGVLGCLVDPDAQARRIR